MWIDPSDKPDWSVGNSICSRRVLSPLRFSAIRRQARLPMIMSNHFNWRKLELAAENLHVLPIKCNMRRAVSFLSTRQDTLWLFEIISLLKQNIVLTGSRSVQMEII